MGEYEVVDTDAGNIDACSFCGYKAGRSEGHRRKTEWLRDRYGEGLQFKVIRSRKSGDIGMIEYAVPPENSVHVARKGPAAMSDAL